MQQLLFKLLLPSWVSAITLPWGVYYRDESPSIALVRHEEVHQEQMKRDGWCLFYVKYVYYWFTLLIKYKLDGRRAYRMIPYEIEARKAERRIVVK